MGIFRLERGLVVQIGERRFAFHRRIDDKKIQLEDVMTGELRTMSIAGVLSKVNSGQYAVLHQTVDGVVAAVPSSRAAAGHTVLSLKLTPAQNAQWQLRCQYVRGMYKRGVTRGQRSRVSDAIQAIARMQDDSNPPSASAVMEWMRVFEKNNREMSALVSHNAMRTSPLRLPPRWRERIQQELNRHYFVHNGESVAAVARRLSIQAGHGNLRDSGDRRHWS